MTGDGILKSYPRKLFCVLPISLLLSTTTSADGGWGECIVTNFDLRYQKTVSTGNDTPDGTVIGLISPHLEYECLFNKEIRPTSIIIYIDSGRHYLGNNLWKTNSATFAFRGSPQTVGQDKNALKIGEFKIDCRPAAPCSHRVGTYSGQLLEITQHGNSKPGKQLISFPDPVPVKIAILINNTLTKTSTSQQVNQLFSIEPSATTCHLITRLKQVSFGTFSVFELPNTRPFSLDMECNTENSRASITFFSGNHHKKNQATLFSDKTNLTLAIQRNGHPIVFDTPEDETLKSGFQQIKYEAIIASGAHNIKKYGHFRFIVPFEVFYQ